MREPIWTLTLRNPNHLGDQGFGMSFLFSSLLVSCLEKRGLVRCFLPRRRVAQVTIDTDDNHVIGTFPRPLLSIWILNVDLGRP